MLFIIDMQNDYVDKGKGKKYIKDSEKMVEGIIDKIREYKEKGEYIFYTSDISLNNGMNHLQEDGPKLDPLNDKESINLAEEKATTEEIWASEIFHSLKPFLEEQKIIKKSYYALPPETLLEIQEMFKNQKIDTEEVEFVGVETHICVLANAICIQSAFPKANIIINSSLCKSKNVKDHNAGLKIMKSLGMEIRR